MLEWLRSVLGQWLVDPWMVPLSALMLGAVLFGPLVRRYRRQARRPPTRTAEPPAEPLPSPEPWLYSGPPASPEPPPGSEPPPSPVPPRSSAPPPSPEPPRPVTLYRHHEAAGPPLAEPPEERGREPSDAEERGRTRYANAALLDPGGEVLPAASAALAPGAAVLLRLDIGPLSADSQVTAPRPFPDRALPDMAALEVLVSSSDFAVARIDDAGAPPGSVARGRLTLPRDGGPATAPDGGVHLRFRLTAPGRDGAAHCRIGYYYRDTLLQSQQLTAAIGGTGYAIRTDFTLSEDFTDLEAIPERPRISVLTNANHDGDHQLVIRPPGAADAGAGGVTLRVGHQTIGEAVHGLRRAMGERAPSTPRRTPDDLAEDLRRLAPIGWRLNVTLTGHTSEVRDRMLDAAQGAVIQVLRPAGSVFAFPWAWIYDIPLIAAEPALCPLLRDWDGKAPLFAGAPGECPHGPHFEDVLCPFGFWGFRHVIEQLSSTDRPVLTVPVAGGCDMVVAQTRYDIDQAALVRHVAALGATLRTAHPGGRLSEAADKAAVRAALGRDLALVYFYCHGERRNLNDPDVYLSVGADEAITAPEFIGWVDVWRRRDRLRVWDGVRPLVFVNACHSAAIYPETLVSYLDAFVGRAHAAGVIGTEVKVHQDLAMAFAERFFALLLGEPGVAPATVGEALRTIRLEYLAQGNLFGLMYTPYCWADLRLGPG